MSIDLILYAVIAAGLIFWLRSILGTRHGEERSRAAPPIAADAGDKAKSRNGFGTVDGFNSGAEETISTLVKNPGAVISINPSAEAGLLQIAGADRGFDVKDFLNKAQDAFAIVVESFAEGDKETLIGLLKDPVYRVFKDEMIAREAREETQVTEVHAIKSAEIIDARLEKQTAFITVNFLAEESTVVKDSDGDVISGHPDRKAEMRDIWVFSRELKSRDPRWWLHETKGDFDGDNDMIPDSDRAE